MRSYLTKICSIALFALFAYPLNIAIAQDRDPFSPSGSSIKTTSVTVTSDREEESSEGNPVTSGKLSSYKVVGTIISDKKKLAAVKALSGVNYIITVGDKFGSEGGRIKDITHKGIKVENNGNIMSLQVSNKIEVNVEE